MRTHLRRGVIAGLTLATALTLAACGNESDDDAAPRSAPTVTDPAAPAATVDPADVPALRNSQPGVISVDGGTDPLTTISTDGYRDTADYTVATSATGDTRAYQRLCVGDVDVVDSSRPISPQEWAQCHAAGLDVVQFQVGAEAIVLAIQNQSVDVGSDCLSTTQAKTAFKAGSTINNWSQLGENFDSVPLDTGGPGIDTGEAQFFGSYVLGAAEPSLSNFRSDYVLGRGPNDTRFYVAGRNRDRRLVQSLALYGPRRDDYANRLKFRLKELSEAQAEVRIASAERAQGIRDGRPAATQREDQARKDASFAKRAIAINRYNAARARFKPTNAVYQKLARAKRRLDALRGRMGIFKFSYYQVYEEQLRPFEIEVAEDGNDEQNCIFPSPATILSGEYPLSRQLLLTTTTRSLKRAEVKSYLSYYLTQAGENARDSSVIALPEKDLARQREWIETGKAPLVVSVNGGPTEVQPLPMDGTDPVVPDESDNGDDDNDQVENPAR